MKMNITYRILYIQYGTVRKSTENGSSMFPFTKIKYSTQLHTYILDTDAKSHQKVAQKCFIKQHESVPLCTQASPSAQRCATSYYTWLRTLDNSICSFPLVPHNFVGWQRRKNVNASFWLGKSQLSSPLPTRPTPRVHFSSIQTISKLHFNPPPPPSPIPFGQIPWMPSPHFIFKADRIQFN